MNRSANSAQNNPKAPASLSDDEARAGLRDVPDTEGARHFYERFAAEHPRAFHKLANEAALLSDVLALAAWSPLLGTTLLQQPDYVVWLARERVDAHVRTCEELSESLARFALTHTQLQPPALLARFRRRELLRTYLHDIRRLHTVVETTEELSNLADAALSYALDLARQELDNRHGPPLTTDERGRKTLATSCVVSLGKLGSRELNYASDIDLLFIYSADGDTSGAGERGPATNREYFNRLAEKIAQIVGGQAGGEGAAFRVDLRLRPHGRVGALSVSLAEAVTYYREAAQAWELQALLRARASAGDAALYARFAEGVRARVYGHAGTAEQALDNVRLAKQKIDRHHTERAARGYNVKLGRGGVREIEFVAQALQLAHGGRDPWLQAAHTLVALGRLADRGLIQEGERAGLSDAYTFLRRLEHRLQMEHGLQTHVVPDDSSRRALVARRMGFGDGAELPHAALDEFERALAQHTQSVRACFERVFGARGASVSSSVQDATPAEGEGIKQAEEATAAHRNQSPRAEGSALAPDAETAALHAAAGLLAPHVRLEGQAAKVAAGEQVARLLCEAAAEALNARRALTLVARFAASLDKSEAFATLDEKDLRALVHLFGVSEMFGEMLAGNPVLVEALRTGPESESERDYRAVLRARIDREKSFGADLAALRRAWARLLVERGARDAAGKLSLAESNRFQTALAAASINAAYLIARREMARRCGKLEAGPRLAVLGLGRLASGGVDYGSDLDLVVVFDPLVPSPVAGLTREEAYARLVELMTAALSSLTRDGYLYRVDLRLRPDGQNGPLVRSAQSFVEYLRGGAQVWEWLAHVKLRAVGGDLELGRQVELEARRAVHERARASDPEELRRETRRVRERLVRERGAGRAAHATDVKFGPGGMLDVYFAARYLQLRDDVPDPPDDDRSTDATLARLREHGALDAPAHRVLADGYALLRRLDHFMRLISGRSTRLPAAPDHPLLADLARLAGYASADDLTRDLAAHMRAIRTAYDNVTGGG